MANGKAAYYRSLVSAAVMAFVAPGLTQAAPLYAGKTIHIVVGDPSGGGFDAAGRVLAALLPKYLDGHPEVVVENMPGGSSLIAANYLYNVAPEDGTYIGVFNHSLILQTVVDPSSTRFDMSKFNWIGRVAIDDLVGVVWRKSGILSLEDAKHKDVVIGANSTNSSSAMVPFALNHLLGTRFKVVVGYRGLADRYLAMERGEIDGISGASWLEINKSHPEWIINKSIVVLHQNFLKRDPRLADTPTLVELGENADEKNLLGLLCLDETIGKSAVFGPRVPSENVQALRAAFDKVALDPEFIQDTERLGAIPAAMNGFALESYVRGLIAIMTPEFIERFKSATRP